MKKQLITIVILLASLVSYSQKPDSPDKKGTVAKVEMDTVTTGYYVQINLDTATYKEILFYLQQSSINNPIVERFFKNINGEAKNVGLYPIRTIKPKEIKPKEEKPKN